MHNMVYLIGRLCENPVSKKTEKENDMCSINLAVQRSFKNEDGIYETDFIRCVLWNQIAERTCEYCKKGDLIGIKGRIQTRKYEENEETKYITEVIVDKLSFLASKKEVPKDILDNENE